MYVDSYLELFTTLFGWTLYDIIYDIFLNTGLAFIPVIALVISHWKSASTNSKGTPAAELSVKNIMWDIVILMLVAALAFVPAVSVFPTQVKYEPISPLDSSVGPQVTAANSGTTYDETLGAITTGTSKIPIWWLVVYKITSGVNHGIIKSLPTRTDIDAAKQQIAAANISDPKLAHQLPAFISSCFTPARGKLAEYLRNNKIPPPGAALLDQYGPEEADWIGSKILVETPGLYKSCPNNAPNICGESLVANYRIEGLSQGENTPCNVWWASLRQDLLDQTDPSVWESLRQNLTSLVGVDGEQFENARIKSVLNGYSRSQGRLAGGENIQYHGEQGMVDRTGASFASLLKGMLGQAGSAYESAKLSTKMQVVKLALPMVQALLLMSIYMLLPIFIIVARYEVGNIFTLTFVIFAIKFMTALWAIAGWVEFNLYEALYPNGSLIGAITSFQENLDEGIRNRLLSIATVSLWLIIPGVFFYGLIWAGIQGGNQINSAVGDSQGPQKGAADETGKIVDTTKGKVL